MSVDKNTLLKMVNEAITLEDKAIPIYTKHLKTAMFWSGLAPAVREQLRIQLGILEKESLRHLKLLNEMIKTIEEDKRNVF